MSEREAVKAGYRFRFRCKHCRGLAQSSRDMIRHLNEEHGGAYKVHGQRAGWTARRRNPTCPFCAAQISDPEKHAKHVKACEKKVRTGQASMFGQQQLFPNPGFMTVHHGPKTSDVHPLRSWANYDELRTVEGQQRARRLVEQIADKRPDVAEALRTQLRLTPRPAQVVRREQQLEREVRRDYAKSFKLRRPAWAYGWSQRHLEELAEYAGIPHRKLNRDAWWEDLKPEVVSEFRDRVLTAKRGYGLPPSRLEQAHRRAEHAKARKARKRNPGPNLGLIAALAVGALIFVNREGRLNGD